MHIQKKIVTFAEKIDNTMKRIYSILLAFVCIAVSYAATGLNPYAYKLEAGAQSDANRKMTVRYWLNAPADAVAININYMEAGTPAVRTITGTTKEGVNEVTFSIAGLPTETPLSWSVTVNKASNTSPKQISTYHSLYCPQGVAVNTNPYSQHFGRIFVTESLHNKTVSKDYVSKKDGKIKAGIYTFSPQFALENTKGVPKGDKDFKQIIGSFTNGYGTFDGGHQPWQIKISDDDRIFVSSGDARTAGAVIWELDTIHLETLTPIIKNGNAFNSQYRILNSDGSFYAGMNCSMDVKGSGENLKLLLYSTTKNGLLNNTQQDFRLDEYAIGTSTSFTGTPTNIACLTNKKNCGVVYDKVNVIYDYEGGYWLGASRARELDTEPNLLHIKSDGTEDTRSKSPDFYGGAGIMLHKATYAPRRNETWLFKGLSRNSTSNGRFGIWKITKNSSGNTTRERIWTVISTGLGRNHNAFDLDYAENLYVVGNSGERIIAFALPYEGTKTTPAKETFTLAPVDNSQTYNVTVNIEPAGYGTATGAGAYLYGEQVTVTAIPSDPNRYEFEKWVAGSGNVYYTHTHTFKITGDVTLTAHFKEKKYKVEYFKLFQRTSSGYQDITDYYRSNTNDEDHVRNTRLWRLFQVQYNNRFDPNHSDFNDFTNNNSKGKWAVMKFLDTETSTSSETRADLMQKIERFVDQQYTFEDAKNSFYWLGQYIEHIVKYFSQGTKTDIEAYTDNSGVTNIWAYYLQAFFNRDVLYNRSYEIQTTSLPNSYPAKNVTFAEYGKPDYWRKWWQQIDCNLDTIWTYDKAMPIDWACRPFNGTTYITIDNTSKKYYPSTWFRWNNDTAQTNQDKLLGWYYGEKDPTTWTDNVSQVNIVHNVHQDGNLIAIWVDKEIREDKNNYDVQMLMSKQGTTHNVKVYHPLQAGMYNTICLPFPLSTLEGTPYAGATVLRLVESELENENVTEENLSDNNVLLQFEQVTFSNGNIMEAGVPYLIMPTADIIGMVTFTGIDRNSIYTGEGESIETDYITMHGCINPTLLEADNNTLILVSNNQLAVTSEQGEILGLRAYFTLSGTAYAYGMSGQTVMQLQKQTPTAVEEIEDVIPETSVAKGKKVMYQGQLYILRDGKAYNMQGQVVGTSEEIIK